MDHLDNIVASNLIVTPPEGYRLVTEGNLQIGDLIWLSFTSYPWHPPTAFDSCRVEDYHAVARRK